MERGLCMIFLTLKAGRKNPWRYLMNFVDGARRWNEVNVVWCAGDATCDEVRLRAACGEDCARLREPPYSQHVLRGGRHTVNGTDIEKLSEGATRKVNCWENFSFHLALLRGKFDFRQEKNEINFLANHARNFLIKSRQVWSSLIIPFYM